MPTDSGTNDILSLGFLHYTTAVSREMSDEPNIRQQRNRNHRQPSLDGQRHRPRGTYLRHRRDGLYQQRQYAAKTARPDSLQDIRY